ncbi:hypothetical protein Htur_4921 (plasmid) [Haloterrigena turkmenica DSM 5511]|uniref:Halobacterial output domain-containing protein n=1 Tax=Haloterrigena turkmenica (strain ATCC 51198 / DSM 5511 / JCM 9101 / NCIMB 13204 / VKM B-1734 / 4k) TaxID=543526 RepID=D2S2R1_HALTV|nr:HalOD1 output domain-containing protein [Haloterrigena turkmenica]ADB63658.1 hypothetical protein Htur_4921 [Haloterrigena turkmenica DSM 5511]
MDYETPYYLTFDDEGLPSVQVIQAIASIVGAGHGELSPLQSVIDPDALNQMAHTEGEWSLSFEYEGFHVSVHSDGQILLRDPESVHTRLGNVSNVLLLAPEGDDNELCTDLQFTHPPDRENILTVTVDQAADETVNEWHAEGLEMRAQRKIVSLGDFARSAGTQSVTLPGPIEADLIADDQDLDTLHERIASSLSAWQSNPHLTTLCFRSIDELLTKTDLDSTFSFLYSLTKLVHDSETVAHYHLDPLACDDDVINILTPLFDAIVSEDGDRTVSTGA